MRLREYATPARTFGAFFIGAGLMHFVIPRPYTAIVPQQLPARRALVYASGVAEILGGAGVLFPATRRAGALWSVATLAAVFPANVGMAVQPDRYSIPRALLWARLPVQGLFAWWALAAMRDER